MQVTRLQEDAVRSASSKYFAEIDLRPNCHCAVQCIQKEQTTLFTFVKFKYKNKHTLHSTTKRNE